LQQEAAKLRKQFIAVMGHDLRNPLAAIQAGIMLLEKQSVSERGILLLSQMRRSGDRMEALIADVLDLARGRLGGGFSLTRETVIIGPIIQQVVAELASTHRDHSIEVECESDQRVDCDPDRFAQLLSNLLGNALTHGDVFPTGARGMRFRRRSVHLVRHQWRQGNPAGGVATFISAFCRGLGLYIASEIAAAHGGTLTVASSEAETCFCLEMPEVTQ
jgi:sigma-B regulation protein RsbU (phosphoserine phosphatase)